MSTSCTFPPLPRKRGDSVAVELDVTVAQCRQPERSVLARVFVVPHPDGRDVEEANHGGDNPFPTERAATHVAVDAPPDTRQRPGERREPVVLGLIAHLPPSRVVAVLLAPPGVSAGRLDVAVRRPADPDIRPRRDGERLDPRPLAAVGDRPAGRIQVLEAAAPPAPGDPRLVVGHVAKAGGARRPLGFDVDAAVRPCHVGSDTRGRGAPTAFRTMPARGSPGATCR